MSLRNSGIVDAKIKDIEYTEKEEPVEAIHDRDDELLAPDRRLAAERRLVRKLDLRLLPTIIVIFIMNYIDRGNLTSARLQGLTQDLHLSQIQYSTVLAIFCASYCPFQVPSNMILNRLPRPSYFIPGCVILWGLISTLTGITQNFVGILMCRLMIGFPEAAFYPGAVYLMSRWYTRKELAFRGAIIYGGLLISNAFGGLMAAGILSGMQGKLGIAAWRWLYYIEGAISMTIGIVSIFTLPDYPHNTTWFTPAEQRLAMVRLAEDAGEADEDTAEDSAWHGLKLAVHDPKTWVFSLMNCIQLLGLGFINFFPTIVGTMGFSTTVTLLMTAPPWILSTIVCCLNSWHADRSGERFLHQCIPWWGVLVGYIIAVSSMSIGGRYVAMFLMACGYAGFALTLVWVANVFPRPPAKRAAAMGIINGIGNLGNLISSYTWQAGWAPAYHPSMYIGIACLTASTVLALVLRQMLVRENRRLAREELTDARRARIEEAARLEGCTFAEALERRRGFRYLY